MELRDLVRILSQRRITVVLVTLAVAAASVAYALSSRVTYTATARVLAPQTTVSTVLGEQRPAKGGEWQAGVAGSTETVTRAAQELGTISAEALRGAVTVTAAYTQAEYLILVSATAASPDDAAAYANAVAEAYVALTADALEADVARYSEAGGVSLTLEVLPGLESARARVLTPASAPAEQSPYGRASRVGVLGLTFGLALGIAGAFIAEQLDDTIHSVAPLLKRTRAGLAAGLTASGVSGDDRDALTVIAERLRTRGARVVLVAGLDTPDLSRTVSAGLGAAFTRIGASCAVLDGDVRRVPSPIGSGLERALAAPGSIVRPSDSAAITFLGATAEPTDPLALIASESMADLISALTATHDSVVMAAPNGGVSPDTLALASHADIAVLAVTSDRTRVRTVGPLADALMATGIRVEAVLMQGGNGWSWQPASAGLGC